MAASLRERLANRVIPRPQLSRRSFLLAPFLFTLLAPALGAQQPARPRLDGRVVKAAQDTTGVSASSVVLHMVTADTAGEIDSTRTRADGGFSFDLPTVPDPLTRGEVYFASVRHEGVLYFGPAISQAAQLDSGYVIEVHDTTVAPAQGFALPVRVRYLMVDVQPEEWVVTDGFQVENPGLTTLVAADGGVVWTYPLPPGARGLEIGGGDAAPEAISLVDGILEITAPVTPGIRQYMIRYRLPPGRLDVSMPGPVNQAELLVREPAPELTVTGLAPVEPVEIDPGVTYRRFVALNIEDATVTAVLGRGRGTFNMRWMAVALAMMLVATSAWSMSRFRPVPAGAPATDVPWVEQRERILLEVAGLDEQLEEDGLGATDRQQLIERRRGLMALVRSSG